MPYYSPPASTSRRSQRRPAIGAGRHQHRRLRRGRAEPAAHVDQAVAINSWSEFLRLYAGGDDLASTPLARAVFGFLDNGGSRCWVVNVGPGGRSPAPAQRRTGLQLLEAIDEVAILAAPGYTTRCRTRRC